MQNVGDDLGQRLTSVVINNVGNLTVKGLVKALQKSIKIMKGVDKTTNAGKQKIQTLEKYGDNLNAIEVNKTQITGFDKYARRYNLQYSIKSVKNESDKYIFFFKTKDLNKLESVINDCVKDKVLDNNTLEDKIKDAKEKAFKINQINAKNKAKTKSKSKSKSKEIER